MSRAPHLPQGTRDWPAGDLFLTAWLAGMNFPQAIQMFLDALQEPLPLNVHNAIREQAFSTWGELERALDTAPLHYTPRTGRPL